LAQPVKRALRCKKPRAGAEALTTPVSDTESGYAIVFLPTAADIGVRELEVRIEGEEKPIYRKKVEVKVKGGGRWR
jgi:hypothetical protein